MFLGLHPTFRITSSAAAISVAKVRGLVEVLIIGPYMAVYDFCHRIAHRSAEERGRPRSVLYVVTMLVD